MEYFSRGFTGLLLFTQIRPTLSVMVERQFFPPPEPLQLSIGNSSQNWKRFKQKWSNYELGPSEPEKLHCLDIIQMNEATVDCIYP